MKRSIAVAAVLLLCTISASAQLSTFKGWEESPEGYFMTAEERASWKSVATDADAQKFVDDFRARRGGDAFVTEVKKRAENADKYLSIGKTKGSSTLRGKTVILFGAPINISVSDRQAKGGYAPPPSSSAVTNLGVGASARDADGDSHQLGTGQAGRNFRDYAFTFGAKSNPGFGGKDYSITIEADAATGKDRIAKGGPKPEQLDALFEAAAKASIKQ